MAITGGNLIQTQQRAPNQMTNTLNRTNQAATNRAAYYQQVLQQVGPQGLAALSTVDPGARRAMVDFGLGQNPNQYLDDYTKAVVANASGQMPDEQFAQVASATPSVPFSTQQEQNLRMMFARPQYAEQPQPQQPQPQQPGMTVSLGRQDQAAPPQQTQETPQPTPAAFEAAGEGNFQLPQSEPVEQGPQVFSSGTGEDLSAIQQADADTFSTYASEGTRQLDRLINNIPEDAGPEEIQRILGMRGFQNLTKMGPEGKAVPLTAEDVIRYRQTGSITGEGTQGTTQPTVTGEQLYQEQLLPQLRAVDAQIAAGELPEAEGLRQKAGIRQSFENFLTANEDTIADVQPALEANEAELAPYIARFGTIQTPQQTTAPAPQTGPQPAPTQPRPATERLGQTVGQTLMDEPSPAEQSDVVAAEERVVAEHYRQTGNPSMVLPRDQNTPPRFAMMNPETGEFTEVALTDQQSRNMAESITALQDPNSSPGERQFHQARLRNVVDREGPQVFRQITETVKENPEVRQRVLQSTDATINRWSQMMNEDPEFMMDFLPQTTANRLAFREQQAQTNLTEAQASRVKAETRQLERANEQMDFVREALGETEYRQMMVDQFKQQLEAQNIQNRVNQIELDYAEEKIEAAIGLTEARTLLTNAQAASTGVAAQGVGMVGLGEMFGVFGTLLEGDLVDSDAKSEIINSMLAITQSPVLLDIQDKGWFGRLLSGEDTRVEGVIANPAMVSPNPASQQQSAVTADSILSELE